MRRVQLGDVARIETGTTPSTKNPDYHGGDIPFVKPGDLDAQPKIISEAESYVTDLGAEQGRIIPKNGVMVCCIGSLGKLAIAGRDMITNQQINSVIFDEEKVDPKFGAYFLATQKKELEHLASSTTVAIVNKTNFSKLEIPLPSLSEQKAIVAKLDRAQRLIDIDKEMLAKYDELIQSVFLEMFGDPKSNSKKIKTGKLGDYSFINMGQSPKGSSYNEEGDGEPLLNGPTEFGEKYPKEKQWTTEPKKFAEEDDILFCVRGATAGRTNLADKKYCIGRGLAAIRGEEKLDTTFIHFVLKSHYDYFQNQGQGSTFINIAKKDLSNLEVPVPTKELQDEFVSASKEIENQKQVTKGSLKKSEELFSSLVQGAFG